MTKKFDGVQTDEGTSILYSTEAELGDYEVLYEKWFWDGITAESIVFANEDIVGVNDRELEAVVRESPLVRTGSRLTIKRSETGYAFVNFNFETGVDNEDDEDDFNTRMNDLRSLPTPRHEMRYFQQWVSNWERRLRKMIDDEKHFMLFKNIDGMIVIEKDYEHYPDNPYSLSDGRKIYNDCKENGWEPLDESKDNTTDIFSKKFGK